MTPEELVDALLRPDIPAYLDAGAGRMKVASEGHWPSSDHAPNVWTRDRSVKQFSVAGSGDRERAITNDADYSGYTDGGFTRKGEGTAKPWHQRGSAPYLEQVAEAEAENEAESLLAHILGGFSG